MKEYGISNGSPILRLVHIFLLIISFIISLALLVTGFSIIVDHAQLTQNSYWLLLIFAILVSGYFLLGKYTKPGTILKNRREDTHQKKLIKFDQELMPVLELPELVNKIRQQIANDLHPSSLHIFLHDLTGEHYTCAEDNATQSTTDLRFSVNSSLVRSLEGIRQPIQINNTDFQSRISHSDKSRLVLLDSHVIAPLQGDHLLLGWVLLGESRTQKPYSASDIAFLATVCQKVSIAIDRAHTILGLQQRVHDMDVLSRVAQGVNITPNLDDILELVYTQASQAIVCDNFHIMLQNSVDGTPYYAFCLENNERVIEKEKVPLPAGFGLEAEVSQSQRNLQTDDYYQECVSRLVQPDSQEIYAWIGVPLNAGADTIGAISLGCRDPLRSYTEQQVNLLQAIADQAAGAITKTRLIQITEHRAKQLNMLNEISRSLTSTLEITPLLDQILKSATDILNCDAGSLFMIDESTGELVFEVTVGPVADNLVGMRLPPGTGIVGKAVENAQPIIANDVQHYENWSDTTDKQTGFVTRDLLVVPMLVKEKIMGVIEIINKKDGSPFTIDDQELLATFASQAAIAIDNARLYTQTDQALSARVEELSVMQRIDRELNASLELDRVMKIALNWSMKQSNAAVGLVGLVTRNDDSEEWKIRVMASDGLQDRPASTLGEENIEFPLQISQSPSVRRAFEQLVPELAQALSLKNDNTADDSSYLMIVPVHRRNEPIGIILLESHSKETFSNETIAFLSRLSDHAAIAISNAQLYADLQAANIAKTEFVSLVSHELKTPMTSIKGYADLLAKGAVGPINDAQSNFLNTIRSNVSRMATLVSDLSDISRIEAGRMRLEFGSVSLNNAIEEVIHSTQTQLNEKMQKIELKLSDQNPLVWCDGIRLTQILANLVSNAIKYTPDKGTITISTQKGQNHWEAKGTPEVICIQVSDTGYGIVPEDQKKIFQKFFRSEDQNIREAPGTGLGLNITRHLVEMQGGRIWFESQPGKGTTFFFTIPISSANTQ